jgi:uncharacterized membrane protein
MIYFLILLLVLSIINLIFLIALCTFVVRLADVVSNVSTSIRQDFVAPINLQKEESGLVDI